MTETEDTISPISTSNSRLNFSTLKKSQSMTSSSSKVRLVPTCRRNKAESMLYPSLPQFDLSSKYSPLNAKIDKVLWVI